MTTNKDVRELMEARKACGVPFPKPTRPKLSIGPEPELAAPEPSEELLDQPVLSGVRARPAETVNAHHPQDSRYVPVPTDDTLIAKTYKFKTHRYKQLCDGKSTLLVLRFKTFSTQL